MGVALQVLSSSLVHQCTYDAEPADALRLDRRMNDRIAEAVAAKPDRFRGLGSVPLQSPDLADKRTDALHARTSSERRHHLDAGSRPGNRRCGASAVLGSAEALGAVVFIHPAGNHDARFRKYQLWNSIGQSFEEAMAIASLFYEGILDAYPKLKIVVSHGGGYMPFYLGRLARNYLEKPATRANMSKAADRICAHAPLRHLRLRSRHAVAAGRDRRRRARRDGLGLSGRRQ